jgi:hypothetical protein
MSISKPPTTNHDYLRSTPGAHGAIRSEPSYNIGMVVDPSAVELVLGMSMWIIHSRPGIRSTSYAGKPPLTRADLGTR